MLAAMAKLGLKGRVSAFDESGWKLIRRSMATLAFHRTDTANG